MKYIAILALLGLIQDTSAIRFFDIPTEENQDVQKHFQSMAQADTQIISELDKKIDQAKRNVAQGELGRTLAMNKINEIKLSLAEFKSHFQELAEHAVADPSGEDAQPVAVEKKRKDIQALQQKSEKVLEYLPQVQALEVELGLPEETKDEELVTLEKQMNQSIAHAKKAIRDQQIREAQAEEDKKPKQKEEVVGVPNE